MAKNLPRKCFLVKQGLNNFGYFRKFKHAINHLILNSQVLGLVNVKSYSQYTLDLKANKTIIFTSRSGIALEIIAFTLQ